MNPRTIASRERGFTVVELMISMTLFMLVVAGVIQLEFMGLRSQMRETASSVADANAGMIRAAFAAAVGPATMVAAPAPGASALALTVLHNFDPATGQALVADRPVEFRHLCLAADGKRFYLYQGEGATFGHACGSDPGAGVSRILVAGGSAFTVAAGFARPAENDNLVVLTYAVLLAARPSSGPYPAGVSAGARQVRGVLRHAVR